MIITPINDFDVIKKVRARYVVRIFFDKKRREFDSFWMSEKQYNKLLQCYNKVNSAYIKGSSVICVFDGDRFVWAGEEYPDYSDREWLQKNFKAEFSDHYYVSETEIIKHVPAKIEPKESEPDADLIR